MTDRVIALIDMDCFYVQVEQRLNPSLRGKPCAVVQYKTWKGGGIIAVGYEARKLGVTRNMRGDEAKEKCPDIHLARVPEVRGKADLTRYREAGAEVIAVFNKFCTCVERASVDEAYLDLTTEVLDRMKSQGKAIVDAGQLPNTFVEGFQGLEGAKTWLECVTDDDQLNESELHFAVAAMLVEEMRQAVLEETGFTCSAGIAHNKMLAKLACGRNKPDKQTVLPLSSVTTLFASLPIQKIRHLGGKLGAFLTDDLGLQNMADLLKFTEPELQAKCGYKTGSWLFNACRGIELEPVSARSLAKSIGCGKNFRGKEMLNTKEKVKFWLSELSKEISERLNKDRTLNKRLAKSLTVSLRYQNLENSTAASRACALVRYDNEKICSDTLTLIQQFNTSGKGSNWSPPITSLSLSASKFTDMCDGNSQKISSMFAAQMSSKSSATSSFSSGSNFTQNDSSTLHLDDEFVTSTCDQNSFPCENSQLSHPSLRNKSAPQTIDSNGIVKGTQESGSNEVSKKDSVGKKGMHDKRASEDISFFFKEKSNEHRQVGECSKGETDENRVKQMSSYAISDASNSQFPQPSSSGNNSFFALKLRQEKEKNASESIEKVSNFSGENDHWSISEPEHCDEETKGSNNQPDTDTDVEIIDSPQAEYVEEEDSVLKCPKLSEESVVPELDADDFMECEECGKMISMWEMPEHTDFHFALRLQKDTSGEQVKEATKVFPLGVKRKAGSSSNVKKPGKKTKVVDKKSQPLTMFFDKV